MSARPTDGKPTNVTWVMLVVPVLVFSQWFRRCWAGLLFSDPMSVPFYPR